MSSLLTLAHMIQKDIQDTQITLSNTETKIYALIEEIKKKENKEKQEKISGSA